METVQPFQKRFIFVCTAEKDGDPKYCGNCGGKELHSILKEKIKEKNLDKKIRIVKSGCLDYCGKGPTVLVMPENKLYLNVKKEDAEKLLAEWGSLPE